MALHLPQRDYAIYGCKASAYGRLKDEPDSQMSGKPTGEIASVLTRTAFQRDRDRIIHSNGFRRMKHKTQVFVLYEGDHYRTRLTHSLEVAQIARTAARALAVNEDLAEAIALAHDIGHTPFGHAGEDALNEEMAGYGGFDHNEQTLRVLTQLEERYTHFNGLNLTWETLEGIAKHNGPVARKNRRPTLLALDAAFHLRLDEYASVEAQIANLSDDIAYLSHDFEDGLRAGLISLEQLESLPVVGDTVQEIYRTIPDGHNSRIGYAITSAVITHFIHDMLTTSYAQLTALDPKTPDDVRSADHPVISFSPDAQIQLKRLRDFLFKYMWRHDDVMAVTSKGKTLLKALFEKLFAEPNLLPTAWANTITGKSESARARIVADYVASMTDRYALLEYERIFGMKPKLL